MELRMSGPDHLSMDDVVIGHNYDVYIKGEWRVMNVLKKDGENGQVSGKLKSKVDRGGYDEDITVPISSLSTLPR